MNLHIPTLALITGMILLCQVTALFLQYRINKAYQGTGWWLSGTGLLATGFIFTYFFTIKSLELLARIANPLLLSGYILLYIGIIRFSGRRENRWQMGLFYGIFLLAYYYYMFLNNDISGRAVVVSSAVALITLLTAYELFVRKNRLISDSSSFTGFFFLLNGAFMAVRTLYTLLTPPILSYTEFAQMPIHVFAYMILTITSTLWTFGFIMMMNQRLNRENLKEKEKMQLIFNTSPDAALITRLEDGLILDANVGFSVMTDYAHDDIIGTTTTGDTPIWCDMSDRRAFMATLLEQGFCENLEFAFRRRDGSPFDGLISGRLISIHDQPHIVSVIRDITDRKLAEEHIQKLVQQLETEKNTAQRNAVTDSLTGLPNRRFFDDALSTEFFRMKRSGARLSLILLDVDHFKSYNDHYGHLAGDDCLRRLGAVFKAIPQRKPDIVARYGGEEFVFILPEIELSGAEVMAEHIRKIVEALKIPHAASETAPYITVSLGVVTVRTSGFSDPEQVLKLADAAMYRAKQSGRNCVAVSTDAAPILSLIRDI